MFDGVLRQRRVLERLKATVPAAQEIAASPAVFDSMVQPEIVVSNPEMPLSEIAPPRPSAEFKTMEQSAMVAAHEGSSAALTSSIAPPVEPALLCSKLHDCTAPENDRP